MIRLLIADDHAVVRKGLKQIAEEAADIEVCGEARDATEVLQKAALSDFDLLILDISMPGARGLDLLKQIKEEHPRLPVLILTMHSEEHYAVRALKAGADGYLAKESAPDELIKAIRKTAGGGKYLSPSLAEMLADAIQQPADVQPHEFLSDREFQVLRLIAMGRRAREIGEELNISEKTVSTYRCRILKKMRMDSNAQLMRYALANGLVQ